MENFAGLHQFGDIGLIALRIVVAAIFAVHGTHKWAMWKIRPSEQMPAGMLGMLKFLSIVEPLGAVAVFAGFLTQLAAAGLGIIMLGAIGLKVKVMKEPFTDSKNHKVGWEYDLIILAAALALFFFGAGRFSLDQYLFGI